MSDIYKILAERLADKQLLTPTILLGFAEFAGKMMSDDKKQEVTSNLTHDTLLDTGFFDQVTLGDIRKAREVFLNTKCTLDLTAQSTRDLLTSIMDDVMRPLVPNLQEKTERKEDEPVRPCLFD